MDKEILENIKKYYIKRKKMQEEYNEIISLVNELKDNEYVKKYIELQNKIKDYKYFVIKDDEQIFRTAINEYIRKNNIINNIYIYLGTYSFNYESDIYHGSNDYKLKRNDRRADYNLYTPLEKDIYIDQFQVPIKDVRSFEKENKIIYHIKPLLLQEEYIKDIFEYGEEMALKRIVNKYGISGK